MLEPQPLGNFKKTSFYVPPDVVEREWDHPLLSTLMPTWVGLYTKAAGHLVQARVRALGLSGVDAGLLRATKLLHPGGDLGHVGAIQYVNVACLQARDTFAPPVAASPQSLPPDEKTARWRRLWIQDVQVVAARVGLSP